MPKLALCVKANAVHKMIQTVREEKRSASIVFGEAITDLLNITDLSLEDRATCETDPSLLQLIPYITVRNSKGNLFCYSRGKGSEEARLAGALSIGLGGHVESLPDLSRQSLYEHLRADAVREIKEEIGVDVNPRDLGLQALLVNAEDEVNTVHLGLYFTYQMPADQDVIAEANVIEGGEFVARDTLLDDKYFPRMERWSKLALQLGRPEAVMQ